MNRLKGIWQRFITRPVRDGGVIRSLLRYPRFLWDWHRYRAHSIVKPQLRSLYPCLHDATTKTDFDPHYFYQGAWIASQLKKSKVKRHVDIASHIYVTGFMSASVQIDFVDIRPLDVHLPNVRSYSGSLLNLPFKDRSIKSLSCLHVIEHIGLGRYGDTLDVHGTEKACSNLIRVLAAGGNLYITTPIGKERTEFNAHRIHKASTILNYFEGLDLVEFHVVDDDGRFYRHSTPSQFDQAAYALGLFHFVRPRRKSR